MPRCASIENPSASVYDVPQLLINQLRAVTLCLAYAVLHIDNIVRENAVKVFTSQRATHAQSDKLRRSSNVCGQVRADFVCRCRG